MGNQNLNREYEDRFTKPDDAVRKVAALKALDLSKISDSELSELINSYFHIIPFTDGTIPAGTELFRARINKGNGLPHESLGQIYAPSSDLIEKYGRANKPGERIFYCASNYKLAAFEVIQDLKNSFSPKHEIAFVTVGIWKAKVDLHLACVFHDPQIHDLRKDILESFTSSQKRLFDGNISNDSAIANNILLQFFTEEFSKPTIKGDYDYKISNFYISALRHMNSFTSQKYEADKFDGINYPSVAMKYKGDNQAIFIESADTKLEFTNALNVICGNVDFQNGEFTTGIHNEAESIVNGEITWKREIYRPH